MQKEISGSYLENNGWKRKGSTYTKGEDVIIYDGCDWLLNGVKTKSISEIKI